MGQVGWIWQGKKYTHQELVEYAKTYPPGFDYGAEMLEGMYNARERDYVSPTMLSGCPREVVLRNQTDYWVPVEYAWAAYRGTIAHLIMEKGANEPGAIIEKQIFIEVELPGDGRKILLKGTPDKVIPDQGLLVDYKTVQDLVTSPKKGWIAQLSIYRWMLWLNGTLIERAIIQQIGMKAPRRLEVPLWGSAKTQAFLVSRLELFKDVFDRSVFSVEPDVLPGVLGPADDNYWKCQLRGDMPAWCSVQPQCYALAGLEPVQARSRRRIPKEVELDEGVSVEVIKSRAWSGVESEYVPGAEYELQGAAAWAPPSHKGSADPW